jgi:hypothetical protein
MVSMKIVRKRHKKLPTTIAGPRRVKVGFPKGAASASNIEKAVWNEFGTRGGASGGGWGGPIPERPFMRNSVRANRGKYRDALKTSAAKILRGETGLSIVMNKLGILAQGDIQSEITALSSPPNSPVTIARKGSSKPLIDTGAMRSSVSWKVDE